MSSAHGERLLACFPPIKEEWSRLLAGQPKLSPLGRTGTVQFLMDATLVQLYGGLGATDHEQWLRRCVPVAAGVHRYCACGVGPLRLYFATGEQAIQTALATWDRAEVAGIIGKFRALGNLEIASLCHDCPHPDWSGCGGGPAADGPHAES